MPKLSKCLLVEDKPSAVADFLVLHNITSITPVVTTGEVKPLAVRNLRLVKDDVFQKQNYSFRFENHEFLLLTTGKAVEDYLQLLKITESIDCRLFAILDFNFPYGSASNEADINGGKVAKLFKEYFPKAYLIGHSSETEYFKDFEIFLNENNQKNKVNFRNQTNGYFSTVSAKSTLGPSIDSYLQMIKEMSIAKPVGNIIENTSEKTDENKNPSPKRKERDEGSEISGDAKERLSNAHKKFRAMLDDPKCNEDLPSTPKLNHKEEVNQSEQLQI